MKKVEEMKAQKTISKQEAKDREKMCVKAVDLRDDHRDKAGSTEDED